MKSNHREDRVDYVKRSSVKNSKTNQRNKVRWLPLVAVLLILAVAVLLILNYIGNTDFQIREGTLEVELGSELVFDQADWIDASPELLTQIKTDTSAVDTSTAGTYFISVTFKQKNDLIEVVVKDTTEPIGIPATDKLIAAGRTLPADEFIADVFDHSNVVVSFDETGQLKEKQFNQSGVIPVDLFLTDSAGNQKKYSIELTVMLPDTTAPVFKGLDDARIVLGDHFDPLHSVTANDETDGDLTGRIEISGQFDTMSEGTYQIEYRVTDSSGNIAGAERILNVEDTFADLKTANDIKVEGDSGIYSALNNVLEYLGGNTSKVGMVYEDLVSGTGFSINADRQFRSASTAKLFVNMALYDLAEQGKVDLSEKIYYTEADYEGGTGILQNMDLSVGYSLGTLADYAMLHSDNIAFKMIRRYVGRTETFDYYESIIGHPTDRSMTSMSAADGASLIRHLYNSQYETFDHMLDTMLHTDFNDMLPKYLPENIVAHKIGFYSSVYHDVGIVYDSEYPYIITVFSDDLPDARETIAQISKIIYDQREIS